MLKLNKILLKCALVAGLIIFGLNFSPAHAETVKQLSSFSEECNFNNDIQIIDLTLKSREQQRREEQAKLKRQKERQIEETKIKNRKQRQIEEQNRIREQQRRSAEEQRRREQQRRMEEEQHMREQQRREEERKRNKINQNKAITRTLSNDFRHSKIEDFS